MTRLRLLPLLLVAIAAPALARHKRVAEPTGPTPGRFVIESALPVDRVVQCLETGQAAPAVLKIDDARRVLLGTGKGWIDVRDRLGGSVLATRTEWVEGPRMERWARSCAAGQTPHIDTFWSSFGDSVPFKRLWPGFRRPN